MKVSVELGDDVLSVVDELAIRSGRPRDEIIAEAVRQQTALAILADLLVGATMDYLTTTPKPSWRPSATPCAPSAVTATGSRVARQRLDRPRSDPSLPAV